MDKKNRKKKRVIPTPRKIGGGDFLTERAKKMLAKFPKLALTNFDLIRLAKKHKIANFRGVFMSDNLPSRPKEKEVGIMNLDSSKGGGTHWVCYKKNGKFAKFFDSSGNKSPPPELVRYLIGSRICFNRKKFQDSESYRCGHLCLLFLMNLI